MTNELLLLKDVCKQYFGITEITAKRKAKDGRLPVPAFRIAGTRKGEFYVEQSAINAYIQSQIEQARKLNSKMRDAGLV